MGLKLIEIIGAPGVGKTTLMNKLLSSKNKYSKNVAKAAIVLMRPKYNINRLLIRKYCLHKADRWPKLLRQLLYKPPTNSEMWNALDEVAEKWEPFVKHCLSLDGNYGNNTMQHIMGIYWFIEALKTRALIETYKGNGHKIVLMDEPLSYRLSMFSRLPRNKHREKKYYELMPLPDGVIHIHASQETVLQRINHRKKTKLKVSRRHKFLNDDELLYDTQWALEIAMSGALILERRGVPVLWLNNDENESIIEDSEKFIGKIIINAQS